jgi:hypothetical protein
MPLKADKSNAGGSAKGSKGQQLNPVLEADWYNS